MKKNNVLSILVAIVVVAAIVILSPKNQYSPFSSSGGGLSLKDLNKKDTVETSANFSLQANQTIDQTLVQGLFIGRYYKQVNGFYFGGGTVAAVSTEFGVLAPVLYSNAGLIFTNYQIDYTVGKVKRTSITTPGVDSQYSNFCTLLGEGAAIGNAMQLAFIMKGTKFGFGHQGGTSFYDLKTGCWYAFMEMPVSQYVSVAGGVDFGEKTSGYVAAKASFNDNALTVTGNQLGKDNQNLVVTYNRNNISLWGNKFLVSISGWAQKAGQGSDLGTHLVAGWVKNRGTFFAELGARSGESYDKAFNPYFGLGTSFSF